MGGIGETEDRTSSANARHPPRCTHSLNPREPLACTISLYEKLMMKSIGCGVSGAMAFLHPIMQHRSKCIMHVNEKLYEFYQKAYFSQLWWNWFFPIYWSIPWNKNLGRKYISSYIGKISSIKQTDTKLNKQLTKARWKYLSIPQQRPKGKGWTSWGSKVFYLPMSKT